jgi:hypothetical protein
MKRALRLLGVLTVVAFAAPAVVPAADDALAAVPKRRRKRPVHPAGADRTRGEKKPDAAPTTPPPSTPAPK